MKHITGDFNRWITRSENQMETCETIGVDLLEEAKILYFMNNLNDSIFGDIKANFLDLSTRALSPQTYDELKQRMIAEYGQISMRKPHTVMKRLRAKTLSATENTALKLRKRDATSAVSRDTSTRVASTSKPQILSGTKQEILSEETQGTN